MPHASWLHEIFVPKYLKAVGRNISKQINADKRKLKINAIAATGMSGALIAGYLSALTGLPIILVRKEDDGSHSNFYVEYPDNYSKVQYRYCIVDDFISSGSTMNRIIGQIEDKIGESIPVKIYLYHASPECTEFHSEMHKIVIPVYVSPDPSIDK